MGKRDFSTKPELGEFSFFSSFPQYPSGGKLKKLQGKSQKTAGAPRGNTSFPTIYRERGEYTPVYRSTLQMVKEGVITLNERGFLTVLIEISHWERGGKTTFTISSAEITSNTGLSTVSIRKFLKKLSDVNLITINRTGLGLANQITLNFENICPLTPTEFNREVDNICLPTPTESVDQSYIRKKDKISSRSVHQKFIPEIQRLISEKIATEDEIFSFIETQIKDPEKIKSLYAVIKSRRGELGEIHNSRMRELEKVESERAYYENIQATASQISEESLLGVDEYIETNPILKSLMGQFNNEQGVTA